ncbi:MAG: glycosyltransferase family 4 protein [Candidatus Omnitrophota bacterium]
MKILFFTIGNEEVASSRSRVYQYLPYLRSRGIEYKVISQIPSWQFRKVISKQSESLISKIFAKFYSFLKVILFIFSVRESDILFIQRVLLAVWLQKFIFKLNNNIVFDFDDAIYLFDKVNNGKKNTFSGNGKYLPRLEHILKSSKCIVLENEYTKAYANKFNKNILLITGPIDTQRYMPREKGFKKDEVVLGWIGSPSTSVYLEQLSEVFKILKAKYSHLVIELVGLKSNPFQLKVDNIVAKKWSLDTEVADLQNFDIGIMPLDDSEWTRSKGGYKLLQYMAVGIPCVASPVGINSELIQQGVNGFLASNKEEWLGYITRLIEDENLRVSMGRRGRQMAENSYSYEKATPKLLEALYDIVKFPRPDNRVS